MDDPNQPDDTSDLPEPEIEESWQDGYEEPWPPEN